MASTRKVIITCAVTGSVHTPSMTPHLQITPDEIARESIDAAEAGAAERATEKMDDQAHAQRASDMRNVAFGPVDRPAGAPTARFPTMSNNAG